MGSLDRTFALQLIGMVAALTLTVTAAGAPAVRYACSNQVYQSFSEEHTKAFTEETGIAVELVRGSSSASIAEVLNGRMDVASSARGLRAEEKAQGLREVPFCVSPIALITKAGCGIETVAKDQVFGLFTGALDNWGDLAGPDLPITVVVPSEGTAAHRNFRRLVAGSKSLWYDFLAYDSTGVIDLVRNLPCGAVSFIAYGAVSGDADIRALAVSGHAPTDADYPYAQTFLLVTKDQPTGASQSFVDFAFSPTARSIIERHGMVPISPSSEAAE